MRSLKTDEIITSFIKEMMLSVGRGQNAQTYYRQFNPLLNHSNLLFITMFNGKAATRMLLLLLGLRP
jgi:hypothetical protein